MPRLLSVVHVGPDPQHLGGISSVISMLCEHEIGGPSGFIVSWVPGTRRARLGAFLRAASAIARMPRTTLVHVHMAGDGSIPRKGLLLLVSKLSGHRTAATLHGSRFGATSRRHPRMTSAALRGCDLVLVLSPELHTIVTGLAPGANVHLVGNPAQCHADPADAGHRAPLVLFAGEVGLRKGADVLMQAWPMVRAAVPGASLTVCGPTADVRIAESPGVTVRGPLDRTVVGELLTTHRVVALPSRAEALPMILLEAMGAGCPFVSTDVGDIARLAATGGGVVVPTGDADALAAALVRMLTDDDVATAAGRAGHAACREEFSVDALRRRTELLYAPLRGPAAR